MAAGTKTNRRGRSGSRSGRVNTINPEWIWTFESSTSPGVSYETIEYDNGRVTCNCPGWRFKKGDKPRTCKHVKHVRRDRRNRN